jgi:hypothetical protein
MNKWGRLAATHCQSFYSKELRRKRMWTQSWPWGPTVRKSLLAPPHPQSLIPVDSVPLSIWETALQQVAGGGCRSSLVCLAVSGWTTSLERRKPTREVTGRTLCPGNCVPSGVFAGSAVFLWPPLWQSMHWAGVGAHTGGYIACWAYTLCPGGKRGHSRN